MCSPHRDAAAFLAPDTMFGYGPFDETKDQLIYPSQPEKTSD
jgi:hypothetical protein